jgi:3'(2'), 5'-bisphosphate nucleotidase
MVAENIISESLSEINPHIPIISPSNGFRTPYLERRGWNHFWLIDPLNIIDGSPQTGPDFTVSIALIEDRTPFLGIVYAPRSDTVYYGMKGKGSYKMICGGEPNLINGEQDMNTGLPSFPTESTVSSALHNGDELRQSNITLKICFAAESESRTTLSFTNSMEWEIAGAHAVVSSVGMRVVTSGDKRELTYNKEEFRNSSILIEPT